MSNEEFDAGEPSANDFGGGVDDVLELSSSQALHTLVAVDCNLSMSETWKFKDESDAESAASTSGLTMSRRQAVAAYLYEMLRVCFFDAATDNFGLLVFNCGHGPSGSSDCNAKNIADNDYEDEHEDYSDEAERVFTMQPLMVLTPELLRACQQLGGDRLAEQLGGFKDPKNESSVANMASLADVMQHALRLFNAKQRSNSAKSKVDSVMVTEGSVDTAATGTSCMRQLIVITNIQEPIDGKSKQGLSVLATRAEDLRIAGVHLTVVQLCESGQVWKEINDILDANQRKNIDDKMVSDLPLKLSEIKPGLQRLTEIIVAEKPEDLLPVFMQRKKRAKPIFRGPLYFSDRFWISVHGYNLFVRTNVPGFVPVYARDMSEVTRNASFVSTRYTCEGDTNVLATNAVTVPKNQLGYAQQIAGSTAILNAKEFREISMWGEPEIRILRFVPSDAYGPTWCMGRATHIVPADARSAQAFSGLVHVLSQKNRIAVARVLFRRNNKPRLAVLVPRWERRNEDNKILSPTALVLFQLPYIDERNPDPVVPTCGKDSSVGDTNAQCANGASVCSKNAATPEAASHMSALCAKFAGPPFDPQVYYNNAALRKFRDLLHSKVLGEPLGDVSDYVITPDFEHWQTEGACESAKAFLQEVGPLSTTDKVLSRKIARESEPAPDKSEILARIKELQSGPGGLGTLKVVDLKDLLKAAGEAQSGSKAVLVERLLAFAAKN